jgi:hypothetical protein
LKNIDENNDDENINSLIKDLQIPHWKTIIEKVRINQEREREREEMN